MTADAASTPALLGPAHRRSRGSGRQRRQGSATAPPGSIELQRARKLVAAAEAVRELPLAGASAQRVNGRARVSHEAPQERLADVEACQLEAFEQVLALAELRVSAACAVQNGWVDRVRAGLLALLEFLDEEPALAFSLVVHSAQGEPAISERRSEVLDRLARALDDERAPARGYPPPLTAQAVVNGVLGVLHAQLSKPDPGALVELSGSLMSFIVLPFLGVRAARRELARPVDAIPARAPRKAALDLLREPGGRVNHRIVSVLMVIAGEPGLNSSEVASRAGVKDQGHASRLLSRLARLALIENTREAGSPSAPKAWQLTANGKRLERVLTHDALQPQPTVAFDLPDSRRRLSRRAVSVLRVIGDQPGLSSREVAERAGVKSEGQLSGMLTRLVELGLVGSTRDARRRGAPNVLNGIFS
jgi:chromosome segregation and condensation protein ScpB/AcrR family transcriptional regulator